MVLEYVNFLKNEGIDVFLDEIPVDKTAKPKKILNSSEKDIEHVEIKEESTLDLSKVDSLSLLRETIENFKHPLKENAINMVFARGNPDKPKVMFIGEAPGQEEDIKGSPFVDAAGQLLDKMIAAIKLTEKDFYITNVVNYRPDNNRTPREEEIKAFTPFLEKHIDLVKPDCICILGAVSLKALFPDVGGINKNRGKWLSFKGIPTIATFHPAYLLRFSEKKREAWEDLQELQKKIK
ncbi:MAG: uracil-DNA glycosylase [Alphaproteobacteria bacterium]|nr:uracil-DNA glycosylase [Alphaproteobacteria bacterium]